MSNAVFISDDALSKSENKPHSKSNSRNETIDLIRLIAAFGVINIHVPFSTTAAEDVNLFFSPLSVNFFFLTSLVYFIAAFNNETTLSKTLQKSFKRLVVPYLAWTAVYVFLLFAKGLVTHKPHDFIFWRIIFYGESSVQIYFLPELFFLSFLALSVYLMFSPFSNKKMQGVALFTVTAGYFLWGHIKACFGVLNTQTIAFFIASACLMLVFINNRKNDIMLILSGAFIIGLTFFIRSPYNQSAYLYYLTYLPTGGLGLLLVAVGLPRLNLSRFWLSITSASFGIYLCHVVFLEAIDFFAEHIVHKTINYTITNKLLVSFSIFVLSLLFTLALRKISFTKRIFLGE